MAASDVSLGHWSIRDGLEIDVVIETGDAPADGLIPYTGQYAYTIEDHIHVVPID